MNTGLDGFTLLELSIVLVIIGLLAGAVLVGKELIEVSTIRSQASQIEKYKTAVNTFKGKYNCLPGDCAAGGAFGFPARGAGAGGGDGNGVIEGTWGGAGKGTYEQNGETPVFWVDLSMAKLIEQTFVAASETTAPVSDVTASSSPNIGAYVPAAKIGGGNYVYVWSGGKAAGSNNTANNGISYFGISGISGLYTAHAPFMDSNPTITVSQAYNIDVKIDDGYPATGRVTALYVTWSVAPVWVGHNWAQDPVALAASASATTCFDNGGVGGVNPVYSTSINGGRGQNCGISIQF